MSPLFVVQEIRDCDIPEEMKTYKEMKIYKEKSGRKTVKGKGDKKVTGCYESEKDPFVSPLD